MSVELETRTAVAAPVAPRRRIMSRALALAFVASFGASASFYLLLSVVPLYAASVGAGGVGAGLATGAVTALAGLAAVRGLPGRRPEPEQPLGVLAGLRTPALLRPALVFSTTAMAAGVVVTFLPIAVGHSSANLVAVALLVQPAASTLTRWCAGRFGDRHGAARLLAPAVVASAAGMLALVLLANPVAMVVGMAVFGAGFGVAQNASLSLMFDRVPASGYGAVSAVWNLSYDAGMGVGATGFGVLVGPIGYPAGFALTACVLVAALTLARREREREHRAAVPCIGWCSFTPSPAQRPQRRSIPRPGTASPHRRETCRPSCCASCAQPSPSTPARLRPAGSASGTATAGCTAAPRSRSWVAAAPSPSHRCSLPRC
jgi:Major Facilitator Superfamily